VALEALFAVALGAAFGPGAVLFFFVQAFVAISLLEVVNYLEHYGMERRKLAGGGYEKVSPLHSWNASHRLTNYFLFNLQRHSDHHAGPARRYQILRHFSESPQLPNGYAGMVMLALVPPLWRKVMDNRVLTFRARHSNVNPQPAEPPGTPAA
jgi:alkane 1-monooxygenase